MGAVFAVWAFVMFLVSLISIPATPSQQAAAVVSTIEMATTTNIEQEKPKDTPAKKMYEVVKVVDGDTIAVRKNGVTETVRLIGVNAPESVDPRRPVQCFGREASQEMKC